jgi:hypothetical protein
VTHPQPHMRPPARLSVLRRSSAAARRPGARGIALMMAVALILFITAATLISLRAVSTESALQGQERRSREAFFAAQAGIAEAREVVRLKLNGTTDINPVMSDLGAPVTDAALQVHPFYEVIPWTNYTLASTGVELSVDPGVTTANREMVGPDGVRISDFPDASNVRYRVFVVDDEDSNPVRLAGNDTNGKVWLVSVGEVAGPAGTQPIRSIIRMLITPGASPGAGPPCHEAGCETNEG